MGGGVGLGGMGVGAGGLVGTGVGARHAAPNGPAIAQPQFGSPPNGLGIVGGQNPGWDVLPSAPGVQVIGAMPQGLPEGQLWSQSLGSSEQSARCSGLRLDVRSAPVDIAL